MKINELIIVKQLPIIEEHLKTLSKEVSVEVEEAKSLVCTQDTVKVVKNTRSGLTKKFNELETMRKEVKSKVMDPYNEFEKVYKECVSDQFKDADVTLKTKIAEVEDDVKKKKEDDVKAYFAEYLTTTEIDFVEYKQAGIKVGLSNSPKSLKDAAKKFIDDIVSDLALIDTQEHKADILVEYKQSLNCSQAITTVVDRFKRIEAEKTRQEALKVKRQAEKARLAEIEGLKKKAIDAELIKSPIQTPIQEPIKEPEKEIVKEEQKYTLSFKVIGTREKLIELKKFLNEGGYEYE